MLHCSWAEARGLSQGGLCRLAGPSQEGCRIQGVHLCQLALEVALAKGERGAQRGVEASQGGACTCS